MLRTRHRQKSVDVDEARSGVIICDTVAKVRQGLDELRRFEAVGWDIETHQLRPYAESSMFLSIAISDGERTWSIGIDHEEAGWTAPQRKKVVGLLRQFFIDGPTKVAHNLPFDLEWAIHLMGEEIVQGDYGCSQQAAYVLDPGPPGDGVAGHSLDFLCLRYFGLPLKSLTFAGSWKTRLREMALKKLLEYNALDARWCLRVWEKLMPFVLADGLGESYERQMDRIVPVVLAQRVGMPVDQTVTREFYGRYGQELDEVGKKLRARKPVQEFERINGRRFNAASNVDIGRLLADVMGFKQVRGKKKDKKGKPTYRTASDVLETINHPIIAELLSSRSLNKLKGTYVDRFLPDHPKTLLYPDGRLHCSFGIANTRTYRFQSEDPNNQNWPKRKYKEIRRQLVAPPGWVIVAVDQGQIEARVLAMESLDPEWIRMIEEDYDIHQEWAEKIAKIDRPFARLLKEEPKLARHKAKNGWVFPSFYGSSPASIIRNLKLPDARAERLFNQFWRTFAGIKRWQRQKWSEYQKDRCVWSLTGRRRWAPLSWNMVINTPIQTAASDICVDAMVRLSRRAREEDRPFLQPVLQIHDDLTFLMPESEVDEGIETVVEEQLGFDAPWLNVPLMVEVEVGKNLYEMETVGEFRSDAA